MTLVEMPGNLPHPGIEPASLEASASPADSLPLSHWGNLTVTLSTLNYHLCDNSCLILPLGAKEYV